MEANTLNLPVLALRGLTVFPHTNLTFDVERRISIKALEVAMESGQEIFLVTQRELNTDRPGEKDLYTMGTISRVTQILRLGKTSLRVMVEGGRRARLRRLWQTEPYLQGHVEVVEESAAVSHGPKTEALLRQTWGLFQDYAHLAGNVAEEVTAAVLDCQEPGYLADFIAQNTALRYDDKQAILEELSPLVRLRKLNGFLARERDVLGYERQMEGKVRDELVNELIQQFKKMLGEDPLANRNFVRIINHKHYNRLQGLLENQDILYGGWHRDDPESDSGWIAPTLVADTLEGLSKPMGEEIFGPILPIIPYDDLDQALRFINRREKPLALYLFTRSKKTKSKVLNTCSFGGGCINDTIIHLATHHMAFGGVGNSGMGSYHGRQSFETFSHNRAIVDKATWIDLPMRYMPYKKINDLLIRTFIH